MEEGHGSGEAVAEGAQLTLLRVYAQTSFFFKKTLLSAMHSHAFRWFSAAPLVFLFLGLLPLVTAESDLADFLCYVWRRRWVDFI